MTPFKPSRRNAVHGATFALAVAATLVANIGSAHATTATLYGTRAAFITALAGAPTLTQNFESYAAGSSLLGVQVLPQVTLSTNLAHLDAVDSAGIGRIAFASSRNLPEAEYNIQLGGNYKAFGFEIVGFNPATPGTGFLSFFFGDGDLTYTLIPVLPTNATEATPLFFGVISDQRLTGIRWSEGPELGGIACCEETGLDNLIAAAPVPEPGPGWLMAGGLGAASWVLRRRRKAI